MKSQVVAGILPRVRLVQHLSLSHLVGNLARSTEPVPEKVVRAMRVGEDDRSRC
jgi:hypothetical protein